VLLLALVCLLASGAHATPRTQIPGQRAQVAQLQNLIPYSEDLTQSVWNASSFAATITGNAVANPVNGAVTASLITDNTSNTPHGVSQTVTLTKGGIYTLCAYAKAAASGRYIALTANSVGVILIYDLSAGVYGTVQGSLASTFIGASIVPVPNQSGWWHVCLTANNSFATSVATRIYTATSLLAYTYAGTGSAQLYVWGVQLTQSWGPPQNYVQTTSAGVGSGPVRASLLPQNQNWLTNSLGTSSSWGNSNTSETTSAATAPDGTNTATALISTTVSSVGHYALPGNDLVPINQYQTFSIYAKPAAVTYITLLEDGTFAEAAYLLSGAGSVNNVSSGGNNATVGIVALPNGWYRLWITALRLHNASSIRIYYNSTSTPGGSYAAADTVNPQVYVWGAQITNTNAPGPYQPTTSVALNVLGTPRYVPPVTQNFLTFSQAFDNAAWTKTASTINTAALLAPDGTLTGEAVVANTTSSTLHYVAATEPVLSGKTVTFSVYAQAGAVSWILLATQNANFLQNFNLSTCVTGTGSGLGASTQLVNGWCRCSMVVTGSSSVAPGVRIYAANANNGYTYAAGNTTSPQVYLWGAQYVQGNWAGPYKATTSTATDTATANNGSIRWVAQGAPPVAALLPALAALARVLRRRGRKPANDNASQGRMAA